MKYLSFESITYKTRLDSAEIKERLNRIIEPKQTFRMRGVFASGNHKPYEGRVDENTFNINRIIRYKNSFLPRINGVIQKDANGTKIHVKMRLHVLVVVFILIWFLGVGFGALSFSSTIPLRGRNDIMSFIPSLMLIFGSALMIGGFKYESIKSKKYLAQLFEAQIEK